MTKVVVILGFLVSFAAGLVVGTRWHTLESTTGAEAVNPPTTSPGNQVRRGSGSWWAAELGLDAEQRGEMDKIWSAVASRGRNQHDDLRRQYRRERDAAIADLVPAARLAEYDAIIDNYSDRVAALDHDAREAYESAVEQTKQVLRPEQRARYEALLKRHRWGQPGSSGRDRHTSTTTRPSGETRANVAASQPAPADGTNP